MNFEQNCCFPTGLEPLIAIMRVLRALAFDTETSSLHDGSCCDRRVGAATVSRAPRGRHGLVSFEQELNFCSFKMLRFGGCCHHSIAWHVLTYA